MSATPEPERGASASTRIAVIGCGNSIRSDDGVGPEVVRTLSAGGLGTDPRVRLLDAGTDGLLVMSSMRGCNALIIIDACRSGATPGAIFEIPGAELAHRHQPSLTLHDFRWDHALFAAKQTCGDEFPADVTVILVEAASVDFGLGLSAAVAESVAKVADRIEELVHFRRSENEAAQ
jgi:hydrogenase maturation protease